MTRSLIAAVTILVALTTTACADRTGAERTPNAPGVPAHTSLLHASDTSTGHAEPHETSVDHADHRRLAATTPLSDQSLYHLDDDWVTHRGEQLALAALRGRPTVVVMLYASCETACPILIRDALRLERSLPPSMRERTQFVMVTIDPERDAPETLASYVAKNDLDAPNWHFLSGSPSQTRALAALLGVQYRPAANGMFSHTNLLTVLDPEGVVALRTDGLGQPVEPAVDVIAGMLRERE